MNQESRGIIGYFIRHRTLANLVLVMVLLIGGVSADRIRAQFFPDVVVSSVAVQVSWPGAGPQDVENAIIEPLEPSLLALEGVSDVASTAREGQASITVEFLPGVDLAKATEDVQAAVDAVRNFPEGAEDPVVRQGRWFDPVTDIVVSGPVGIEQLARISDELVTRLFAVGISNVTINGLAAPQVRVEVPSAALLRYDMTLRAISDAIGRSVTTQPVGDVSSGRLRLRTGQERRSAQDIAAIPLRSLPDGSTLTVGDVARVEVLNVDRARAGFVGDDPAMRLRITRDASGDAIKMQARAQEVADALQPTLPPGSAVKLVRKRAEMITARLTLLFENGAVGLALVVGLLFLFLNARTALWVAAGVPVAMSAAVAMMYLGGLTINMISLFALIITLGIVVDDAIVVGEHADFRARNLGEPAALAAERGARRMAMPVLASTLTTIIAFSGLAFLGGRFGDLISDIPFTVIAVLSASLLECFLILPNHMAHSIGSARREMWYDWPSRKMNRGLDWLRARVIKPVMRAAIFARYPVAAAMVFILSFNISLVIGADVPFRFFNAPERSSITGNFTMLPGANRADTLEMMREVQRAADAVGVQFEQEYGTNPIVFAMAEVGGQNGRGLSSAEDKDTDLLGTILIELIDADDRSYSTFAFTSALSKAIKKQPRLEEISFKGGFFGPGGDSLSFELIGASPQELKAAAEALKMRLETFPEITGLEDSLAYDKEELNLSLTPAGRAAGLSIDALGRVLRDRVAGIEAANFPDGPRTATIEVGLPDHELSADFLQSTLVRLASGHYVPLGDVVTLRRSQGFARISRENGQRIVTVSGDLAEDDPARAAQIQAQIRDDILPQIAQAFGVQPREGGLAAQQREFESDALIALMLSLVGIYACLAWVFSSWWTPIVVLTVVPFGLIGAIWGHYIWNVPLSIFSVIGLIGMSGIIINDSIILVTTVKEHLERMPLRRAIVEGVSDRFRSILLTTLTTVIGLVPLLYETSSQAAFLKPMVITLVYGLGFGMVLVLLLVPVIFAMQADVGAVIGAWRKALRRNGAQRRVMRSASLAAGLGIAVTLGGAIFWDVAFLKSVAVVGALSAVIVCVTALALRLRRRPSRP